MSTDINQLLNQIHNLPQIPEIVNSIINQLGNPNSDILDIAKNVEKEQMIALKVLRLVNSAHFGLTRKVNSIEEATLIIGISQLKTLVIASSLVHSVPSIPNFDVKQFWNTTFLSASYAKWFADKAQLQAEVAYTAGLLSGLGNILLHLGASKEANEIDQRAKAGSFRPDVEKKRLGFTNQAVCAELLRRWKLGDELITAIEQSAEPLSVATPNQLACAVFLGNYISQSLASDQSAANILSDFPFAVTEKIGLGADVIEANINEILAINSNLEGLTD
ncbi:HDOD domain-containing protein [Methylomonas sp. AM2-LC]|uniref:HDOD domain-containing protein n=1 Tax=Methylomonas sp. AM2-LC TaxID=3153301 RepID=UPI0032644CE9